MTSFIEILINKEPMRPTREALELAADWLYFSDALTDEQRVSACDDNHEGTPRTLDDFLALCEARGVYVVRSYQTQEEGFSQALVAVGVLAFDQADTETLARYSTPGFEHRVTILCDARAKLKEPFLHRSVDIPELDFQDSVPFRYLHEDEVICTRRNL